MTGKILIVSNREEDLLLIEEYLHHFPSGIDVAGDGIQALHKILSSRYTVVVAFPPLELLDIDKLIEIVRTNPNTSSIPFLVIYQSREAINPGIRADVLIAKPLEPETFITTLNEMLPSTRIKKQLQKKKVISFNLNEISVIDILQLLYQNKKTGVLDLEIEDKKGKIYLQNGEIVTARIGQLKGEKALYRIFESNIGSSTFINQIVESQKDIMYPTPHLILKGIKEKDEAKKYMEELEGIREFKIAKDYQTKLKESDSLVKEIISLLNYTTYLNVILDSLNMPDSEVLKILKELIDRGIIIPQKGEESEIEKSQGIISPEQEKNLVDLFSDRLAFQAPAYRGIIILVPEYPEQSDRITKFLIREKINENPDNLIEFSGIFPLSRRAIFNFYIVVDIEKTFPFINTFKKNIVSVLYLYDEFTQDALYLTEQRSRLLDLAGIKYSSLFFDKSTDKDALFMPEVSKKSFLDLIKELVKIELKGRKE